MLGRHLFQVIHDFLRLEHQHIAFQGVEHHFRGIADQGAGNPGARHGADDGQRRFQLMGGVRDQHIRRAFFDMQVGVVDIEFGLERLALFAVARLDGFLELEHRVGRRQHRRRMGADHMQLCLGQAGDIEAMVDDGGMQGAVLAVAVADIDGRQDHAASPGPGGFHQQHGAGAIAQQFPVGGGEQGLLQRVVGKVLLDHQAAAFGLLHVDDGVVQAVVPGLLGGHAVAFADQAVLEHAEQGRVLMFLVAHQQVQMGLGDPGDQLGALEREAFGMLGLDDHQDAADGLHGRDLQRVMKLCCTTIVAGRRRGC